MTTVSIIPAPGGFVEIIETFYFSRCFKQLTKSRLSFIIGRLDSFYWKGDEEVHGDNR
jgi:hypothetical protein